MQAAPLFIVGTERSGSNLLRLILDAHSRLFVPHPPHILKYFAPLEAAYGDLREDARFDRLVADVLALVRGHIHSWPAVPSAAEVRACAPTRDVFGVYAGVYEAARRASGKPRWGCKSTFMVEHGERVLATFPEARFLWLYRDPRDVAASSRRSVFSTFHPYYTAMLWTRQQEAALRLPPANVLRVRYESLVADPHREVAAICDFLGESVEPGMFSWYDTPEAKKSASLSESWGNTGSPMQKDRLGRWRGELTEEEVGLVEAVCASTMAALGYEPSGVSLPTLPPSAAARARYWLSDRLDWLRVEARSFRKDRNVGQRWSRALLLARIRMRA